MYMWKVKNALRWRFIWGYFTVKLAELFTKITRIPTITAALKLVVIRADGSVEDYGVVDRRVVTDDGVAFIVDAFQNITELETMEFHGIGTGSTAENQTDSALVTEITTEYQTDNTRPTGTNAEGATANIYQTVATNTVDAQVLTREHGIFDQASNAGGVLLDRSVFALITLEASDSLQSTYELTFNANG
jgi:hypothetical protein